MQSFAVERSHGVEAEFAAFAAAVPSKRTSFGAGSPARRASSSYVEVRQEGRRVAQTTALPTWIRPHEREPARHDECWPRTCTMAKLRVVDIRGHVLPATSRCRTTSITVMTTRKRIPRRSLRRLVHEITDLPTRATRKSTAEGYAAVMRRLHRRETFVVGYTTRRHCRGAGSGGRSTTTGHSSVSCWTALEPMGR